MTKVKRSLAVLLALIMVLTIAPINSFALSSDIFPEASLGDGNESSLVMTPVIYRNVNAGVDGAEEDWQPTTKVKPGEEVRVRITMKTDFLAGDSDLIFAFDNRIFTGDLTLGTTNTETLSVNTAVGSFAANYLSDNKSQYASYRVTAMPVWDDLAYYYNWTMLDENGDVVGVPYIDNYTYENYDWLTVKLTFNSSEAYEWTGKEWMFEFPLTVLDKPVVTPLIAEGETEANIAANYSEEDINVDPAFITVVDAYSAAAYTYDDPEYGESYYDYEMMGYAGVSKDVDGDLHQFFVGTWLPQVTGYDAYVTTNGRAIFDANGGYYEGAEDDEDTEDINEKTQAVKEGYYGATKTIGTKDDETTLIAPTPVHEKGYRFLGWGTTKTATAADKVSSVSFDFEDTTYYAIWEYYNYTFNVNGGSWDAAGTDTADRVIDGSAGKTVAYTVDGTEVKPVKNGCDFVGWATTSDATSANATVTPAENTTFYAVYKSQEGTPYTVKTYTMGLDGTYPETPLTTSGSGTFGDDVDVTPELGTGFYADTAHEGYKATGVIGTDNEFVIYVAREEYTVTFAPAGGYLDGDKAATTDKPVKKFFGNVIDVPTVARDGYTGGWPEGTGTTVTVDGNKTITAVWTESTTTLGTISAIYTDTDGVEQTVTVLDKEELAALVADLGYTPKTGSTLYIAATEPATMAEGDVFIPFEKLPAAAIHYKVDADNTANNIAVEIAADGSTSATLAYAPVDYTVTYELGADDATIAAKTEDFAYGTEINTDDLAKPERTGYTFLGWATSAENAEAGTLADTAEVRGNMSLYAVWKADKANVGDVTGTYTDEDGNEKEIEILTKEEIEDIIGEDGGTSDGDIVIGPEKPDDFDEENDIFIDTDDIFPTKDGYIIDPDAELPIVIPVTPGKDTEINIPVVLATYTVTYNANAENVTVTPATADVKHGDTIVKTSATPADRAGYTFLGWAETADATAAADITVTGDIEVYAVWQADKANVGGIDGTYTDEDGNEQKVEILTKEELEDIIGEDGGTSDGNIVIAPEKPDDFDEENDIFIDTDDIFPTKDGYILDPDAELPIRVSVTPGSETEVNIPVVLATYTVTYNANAENVAVTPATAYVKHGYTIVKTSATPADRAGYTFLGWATTADAAAAADITVKGNIEVYAVWQADKAEIGDINGTYTDENGDEQKVEILTKEEIENIIGDDDGTSDGEIVIGPEKPADFDEENDIFIDTDDIFPTKDGYILDPDAELPIRVSVTPGSETEVNIPVVLATYTVTYNANAENVAVTPATAYVKHGYTIVKTSATPADRKGYTFLGWSTDAKATAAEDITVTGDIEVYAVWQVQYFDVEFVIPGVEAPYHTDKVAYGTAVEYPDDPTEDDLPVGKKFVAWIPQAITSMPAEKTTVTAQLDDIRYFVTLWVVNDDGDLVEYIPKNGELVATYNKTVEIPSIDDASARCGYDATGWFTEEVGGVEVPEGAYTVTADADIYLQYEPKTVGVYLFAEEACETDLGYSEATYDEYLVLTTETQFDEVPGKTVAHWVVSDGDTTVKLTLDENGKSNYLVKTEEDIFVYAVWNTNACTVTYNVNAEGATIANATGSFPYNTTLTKTNTETPVRKGYEFLGWATTADATEAEEITVTGDIEIFAVWAAEKYTINYEVDGKPYDSAEYAFGADVTVLEVNEEGYDFSGWTWTYVDGEGNTQTTTEPETMPAYDLTATGTLTGKQITVTFNANSGYFNGDKDNTADATYTAACGTGVVVPPVARDGYTLVGWTYVDADGNTQTIAAPVTMPTKDTTYTAKWSSGQSTYAVEIYIMDLDGEYGVPFKTAGIVAATDAVVTLTAEERPGFTFVESLSKTEGTVTADNALVLKLYYSRNEYEVVFDGTTYTFFHGESLAAPEETEVPGKTFLGWTDTEGSTATVELPKNVTAPATYYPVYSTNNYTITYMLNGVQYGEVEEYAFDEEISIREDVKQTGYSFSGWTPAALPATMPAENIVVNGTLTINTYTVNYLDAEGNVFETYEVTYGDAIPVPDGKPTKDYSVFDSWNNDLTEMPDRDLDIEPIFNKVPVKLIAREGSTTVIDEDRKIIYGLQNRLTLDLLNTVYLDVEGDGTIVYETIIDNWYGTGAIVRVRDNETGELVEGQEYVIVVFGDINGDGWITSADTTQIREEISYLTDWSRGEDKDIYKVYAADVTRDNRITGSDTTVIREQIGYIADIDQIAAPATN